MDSSFPCILVPDNRIYVEENDYATREAGKTANLTV